MKRILILLCAFSILACKNEPTLDYAILSGKITNKGKGELTLNSMDRSFKKVIEVAEDGSFIDTLRVDPGTYILFDGSVNTQVYVENGNNLIVNFDPKDFKGTLSVTGKGSEVTNYLLAKRDIEKEMMGEGTSVYLLEEADYKTKFQEIKNALEEKITSTEGISTEFIEKEKRNLNYAYLNKLNIYKVYHAHYAKKPDFEISEGFLADLDNLKFDDEEDFKFSSSYKNLVTSHYNDLTEAKTKEDSTLVQDLVYLETVSDISNETIKNSLLYDSAKYGVTYTENLEDYYNTFMNASTNEAHKSEITESYTKLKSVAKGQPSPKFIDYENFRGGTTSLDDLKGKYVYVDVWATWCGPCRAEIPSLKKVEAQYHDKNIEFVSVSVDAEKDHDKWQAMITDKELGGVQLFSDNSWSSKFVEGYLIKGIPRFILIDPQGNIVSSNAPRPSDSKLIELFDELKI